jgi:hypothetical protein
MSNVVCLDLERKKRQPKVEEQIESIIIFTAESGDEYEFSMEDFCGPEKFPQPRTEYTLFGWSCTIWNGYEERWFTLPDFYRSEDAALAAGTAQELAWDFTFGLLMGDDDDV